MKRRKKNKSKTALIYKKEFDLFEKTKEIINNTEISRNDLFAAYVSLSESYEKLLKDGLKLTKISDLYERKLFRANIEIEKQKNKLSKAFDRINKINGLLPICSSCKKIRDDDGYWNEIEAYISEHSEADFSHSLCPECAKKLYPQYYKKEE
jgi:hypothetical protein